MMKMKTNGYLVDKEGVRMDRGRILRMKEGNGMEEKCVGMKEQARDTEPFSHRNPSG